MLKYIVKRILIAILTLWVIATVLFGLLQLMPGGICDRAKLPAEVCDNVEAQYGLMDPLPQQYARYIGNLLQGDLGTSLKVQPSAPISEIISSKIVVSMSVGLPAIILGVSVGLFAGIGSALKRGQWLDNGITVLTVLGIAVPSYVFATILQYVFAFKLGLVPIIYSASNMLSMVLPVFALSLYAISAVTRYMRTELVEVLGSDYILLAQAKGLKHNTVIWKHAIRNALIPVITVVGPLSMSILTGSLVIERIFGIPGLGNVLVNAINSSDNTLTLSLALFYAALNIAIILVIDVLYGIIDPRIRLGGGK
ncbi:MAG: ABC transporter permease [Culicoidibacterales bacterium]